MRYLHEREAYDQYDEMLNDCYPEISIGSLTYSPSEVLKNVDPTAYRCGFCDWADAERITTDESEAYDEQSYNWTFDGNCGTLTDEVTGKEVFMQGQEAGEFEESWMHALTTDEENELASDCFGND